MSPCILREHAADDSCPQLDHRANPLAGHVQVGAALALCERLKEQYRHVSGSTKAHHDACEGLVAGTASWLLVSQDPLGWHRAEGLVAQSEKSWSPLPPSCAAS